MNNLKQYITEKLKIDNKVSSSAFKTVEEKIMYLAGIDPDSLDEGTSKDVMDSIKENWIDKYNVQDVDCIISRQIEKDYIFFFGKYKGDYIVDDKTFTEYNDANDDAFWDEKYTIELRVSDIQGKQHEALKFKAYSADDFITIFIKTK